MTNKDTNGVNMKFASLFSGGGLADLGLHESGMIHAFGVEWKRAESRVYKHVMGDVLNIDVRDSRLPQFIKIIMLIFSGLVRLAPNLRRREREHSTMKLQI